MDADELFRAGRVEETLARLKEQIRADPSDPELRVFLFQLLCIMGDWDRALTQLNVVGKLDAKHLLMVHVCRAALQCETFRQDVFEGRRTPLFFGEPGEWVGYWVQANQLAGQGQPQASEELRDKAFEAAPSVEGTINDEPFEWIMDGDSRVGPFLEAVVDGKYFWVPFSAIRRVTIEEPADLRDLVWAPAQFIWAAEGESVGLIPVRYPGSEDCSDIAIRKSAKTDWLEAPGGIYRGLGQKMLYTDAGEHPLLQVRTITVNQPEAEEEEPEESDG